MTTSIIFDHNNILVRHTTTCPNAAINFHWPIMNQAYIWLKKFKLTSDSTGLFHYQNFLSIFAAWDSTVNGNGPFKDSKYHSVMDFKKIIAPLNSKKLVNFNIKFLNFIYIINLLTFYLNSFSVSTHILNEIPYCFWYKTIRYLVSGIAKDPTNPDSE